MTIHEKIAQLRQEANARGGSTLLLWAADTLEAMHKALAEAEYKTDCMHCKHCTHRGDDRYCHICVGGRFWEWRGKDENA